MSQSDPATPPGAGPNYRRLYDEHRDFLWGYCYRLLGCAADADDLVQETFLRALERPPADTSRPWRPWLIRVATNLRLDSWRKENRRRYRGPWLPSPIETAGPAPAPYGVGIRDDAQGRYEVKESISFAFLIALEALSSQQRAVLLLRDVYDYSVRETADALGLSESNVKTTLFRARREMKKYDDRAHRREPTTSQASTEALAGLIACFQRGDARAMEQLLARDVRSVADSDGHFYAARVPIVGRQRVALFYSKIAVTDEEVRVELRQLNGSPAAVALRPNAPRGHARRWIYRLELDARGLISESQTIVAPRKLAAVRFDF